ncbi:MAG TPA: metallophosphoesterase [Bacteroidales bacterium]
MEKCFFVSDLHGHFDRYKKLFQKILEEKPSAVFMGGDLLPSGLFAFTSQESMVENFISEVLIQNFISIKKQLGKENPRVFIILGNDDGAIEEDAFIKAESLGIWEYIHDRKSVFGEFTVFGYAYIPPSPFMLKDWEKYDVSRFTDPGCVPPEEGAHSKAVNKNEIIYSTIEKDLEKLAGNEDLSKSIFLFHSPPYQTMLDRAALDGKSFNYVPLDVNIGSIAIKRFIEKRQPLLTLHGHVHESARITGKWQDRIGKTVALSAAHDDEQLALVVFNPDEPEKAIRQLL